MLEHTQKAFPLLLRIINYKEVKKVPLNLRLIILCVITYICNLWSLTNSLLLFFDNEVLFLIMKNIIHLQKHKRLPLDVGNLPNLLRGCIDIKLAISWTESTYIERIFIFEKLVQWERPTLNMTKNQTLQAKSQPEAIRLQMNSNSWCDVDFPYVGKPHIKKKHLPTPTKSIVWFA